ncbi:hypothetical protein F2Q70_00017680 [Brassica cretica]|uniref:Uncharacterized protein n=1 Tax=Brassica cretica TaxID=69181 RepID=A0A3N6QGW2_BRACR|nr:hypothetical protein F2Q70_00017680 [Brassica cretica]KAF2596120.1 hypothetical protein F2Q68_00010619 [Brassica cretica]
MGFERDPISAFSGTGEATYLWRRFHRFSRRRWKQSRMNPLLTVMLPLWLLLLCSPTSVSSPTVSDNRFSNESLEDIYSGTFAQRLLVGFEAASSWCSFPISHQDISVPVALSALTRPLEHFFQQPLAWSSGVQESIIINYLSLKAMSITSSITKVPKARINQPSKDTTILIPMRIEVRDDVATSYFTVSNSLLLVEIDVQCNSFIE